MVDRLTGQINLTALAPFTLLLVEQLTLVKHRESPQSLLSTFTTDTSGVTLYDCFSLQLNLSSFPNKRQDNKELNLYLLVSKIGLFGTFE